MAYNIAIGWKTAKKEVLIALGAGRIEHEQRGSIDVKNRLSTGEVSVADVVGWLRRAKGADHQESPHHFIDDVTVHIVKVRGWYIKWWIDYPDIEDAGEDVAVFVSVHPDGD